MSALVESQSWEDTVGSLSFGALATQMWTYRNESSPWQFQSLTDKAADIVLQLPSHRNIFLFLFHLWLETHFHNHFHFATPDPVLLAPTLIFLLQKENYSWLTPSHSSKPSPQNHTLLTKHVFILQTPKKQLMKPLFHIPLPLESCLSAGYCCEGLMSDCCPSQSSKCREIPFLDWLSWKREAKFLPPNLGTGPSRVSNTESNVLCS